MHNRVRMLTASFLVKDLHLDWTRGARFFMEHLVDGDLASNSHGWQWVAGTGTDAAPYFRIFNPTLQSRRFDPDGTYIRRWVPELRGVAGRAGPRPERTTRGLPAADRRPRHRAGRGARPLRRATRPRRLTRAAWPAPRAGRRWPRPAASRRTRPRRRRRTAAPWRPRSRRPRWRARSPAPCPARRGRAACRAATAAPRRPRGRAASVRSTGSVYTPSTMSWPAGLPSCSSVAVMSRMSSTIWNTIPYASPYSVSVVDASAVEPGDEAADARRRGEQRRRLAADRREVARLRSRRCCRCGAAARSGPRTATRSCGPAARRPRCRATRRSPDARDSRKSPARIACRLPHLALTVSTPRRVSASSITSSWYSEPRCTSSQATPPCTTSSLAGAPPTCGGDDAEHRAQPLAAGDDQVRGDLGEVRVGRAAPPRAAPPRCAPDRRPSIPGRGAASDRHDRPSNPAMRSGGDIRARLYGPTAPSRVGATTPSPGATVRQRRAGTVH